MNATQSVAAVMPDFDCAVLDKCPTPEQNRDLFHMRLASIPKDFECRKHGGFTIINCNCGKHTEDEARRNKKLAKSRAGHNMIEEPTTKLPAEYWTWSELCLDLVEVYGLGQRATAREIGIPEMSFYNYIIQRNTKPIEPYRQLLIKAAIEVGLIEREE